MVQRLCLGNIIDKEKKILIGLILLIYGLFDFLTGIMLILDDTTGVNLFKATIQFVEGILYITIVYGFWTMKSWCPKLIKIFLIALIIYNIYCGEYISVVILAIFAYMVYKNKDIY